MPLRKPATGASAISAAGWAAVAGRSNLPLKVAMSPGVFLNSTRKNSLGNAGDRIACGTIIK